MDMLDGNYKIDNSYDFETLKTNVKPLIKEIKEYYKNINYSS